MLLVHLHVAWAQPCGHQMLPVSGMTDVCMLLPCGQFVGHVFLNVEKIKCGQKHQKGVEILFP